MMMENVNPIPKEKARACQNLRLIIGMFLLLRYLLISGIRAEQTAPTKKLGMVSKAMVYALYAPYSLRI